MTNNDGNTLQLRITGQHTADLIRLNELTQGLQGKWSFSAAPSNRYAAGTWRTPPPRAESVVEGKAICLAIDSDR